MVRYFAMEKRRSDRYPVSLHASITLGAKTYTGLINNVSEFGVGYLMTSLSRVAKDFTPDGTAEMAFRTPSGKTLHLNCEVKWFVRASPNDQAMTMGMKIINPPREYNEYLETLYSNN